MAKGRQKTPAKVKLFKASRLSQPTVDVRKPDGMPTRASDEWDRLAPDLLNAGRLTEGNLSLFVNLCNLADVVDRCQASIEKEGPVVATDRGSTKGNPASIVLFSAMAEQRRLHDKFGLLVSAKGSKEEDTFETFCNLNTTTGT